MFFGIEAERLRDQPAAGLRVLRRRPDFGLGALHMRGAVHRLQRGMRDERIMIGRLDHLRRALQRGRGIAVVAQADGRRLGPELRGLAGKTGAALLRRRALVPFHLEFLARLVGVPETIGDDGDTRHQAGEIAAAVDDEGMAHARHLADDVEIGAGDLAANTGHFWNTA